MMDQTDPRKGDSSSPSERPAEETQETTCCVVGAGPAGVMLSLLVARAGIPVTLLEAHRDFDRDFAVTRFTRRRSRYSIRSDWQSGCTNCRM